MMNLLEDLLASISADAPVRSVMVGAHWTVVCSRFCGLASTIIGDKPHGHERVRIEQQPVEGEYPAEAAVDLIPQADMVALTGSALINHTLDRLLSFCRPGAQVVVLGPSAPLSPVLFEHGASLISGAKVVDEQGVLRTVGQGAILPQVEGVQLLTIAKGHPSLGENR